MDFTFILSYIITYIVLNILFLCIALINKKYTAKMTRNNFIIKYPILLPILMFIISLIFTVIILFMATIGYNETASWWVFVIFSIFVLLSLITMYATLRIKIIIVENDIIYFPAFSKKRNFTFDDITSVKYHKQSVTCYNKKKRIFNIDFMLSGYELFLSRIQNKPMYVKDKDLKDKY